MCLLWCIVTSLSVCVCLSVCQSVCLSVCLSVCVSTCVSVCVFDDVIDAPGSPHTCTRSLQSRLSVHSPSRARPRSAGSPGTSGREGYLYLLLLMCR